MVWNTTQSALYKAVDEFNNGEKTGTDRGENCGCCEGTPQPPKKPENNGSNTECVQLPCGQCPACCQNNSPKLFSGLFSDNDMLLIAGLILILSRQNADKKLILALAFVLLT